MVEDFHTEECKRGKTEMEPFTKLLKVFLERRHCFTEVKLNAGLQLQLNKESTRMSASTSRGAAAEGSPG